MKDGGPCPPSIAHILVWAAGRRLSLTATAPSPAAQGSLHVPLRHLGISQGSPSCAVSCRSKHCHDCL